MTVNTQTAAPHWANLPETTFVLGIRLLYGIYRIFGRLPFRICLYPVVVYYWASKRTARVASMEYLQRVQATHGVLGREPGWRDGLNHFLSFADAILDKLLAVHGMLSADMVRIGGSGEAQLQEALDQGRGALIVTGHLGCMELCRISGERHQGVRLNVLVHTRHAERFNRLLQRLNPTNEVHFIQVTEVNAATAMLLADRIARGEILAMAGDRVPVRLDGAESAGTVTASFLGHDAQWPIGPYLLASLFKCPLFAVACVRQGAGYVMQVDRMANVVELPRRDRQQALGAYAQQFADWLSLLLATSPWAWFNFFSFWQQGGSAAASRSHEQTHAP